MVRDSLIENKKAGLTQFYKWCFYKRSKMAWFKKKLMDDYCEGFSLDDLLETLDYLLEHSINEEDLHKVKNCTIFHGREDVIAPVSEVEELCRSTSANLKIFEQTGHAVFLEQTLVL